MASKLGNGNGYFWLNSLDHTKIQSYRKPKEYKYQIEMLYEYIFNIYLVKNVIRRYLMFDLFNVPTELYSFVNVLIF